MSSSSSQSTGVPADQSREELLTQLELLAEENRDLRESYLRAKQTQYRETALLLGGVGILAVVGGLVVSDARDVLFSLGAIGIFGGILTLYLTPEQFVSATVGRDVYTSLASNEAALAAELGLTDQRVYVPVDTAGTGVRLFVPQHDSYSLPDRDAIEQTIVVSSDGTANGLSLDPSGSRLFQSFDTAVAGEVSSDPTLLGDQLTDALVEQFELVDYASAEVDPDGHRLTVSVGDSVYGPLDRFDHPVQSFIATGMAHGLEQPVSVSTIESEDRRGEYLVTCRWEIDT